MVESANGTDTATSFPQRDHQGLWCHRVVWSITEIVSSTSASVYTQLPKYVLTVACLNMQDVQVMCWEKVGSLSECLKVRDLAARSRRESVSFYGIKLREQSLFIQIFVLSCLIIGWGMLSTIKCFKCCVWIHLLDCENIANWRCCDTALQTAVACFLFFRSRKLPPSHEFSHKLWQRHAV